MKDNEWPGVVAGLVTGLVLGLGLLSMVGGTEKSVATIGTMEQQVQSYNLTWDDAQGGNAVVLRDNTNLAPDWTEQNTRPASLKGLAL